MRTKSLDKTKSIAWIFESNLLPEFLKALHCDTYYCLSSKVLLSTNSTKAMVVAEVQNLGGDAREIILDGITLKRSYNAEF